MFDTLKAAFASTRSGKATPRSKALSPSGASGTASAAQLSRDHFSDALLSSLIAASDIDETLRQAGIARHQLRRLLADDEISAAAETRRAAVECTPWRIDGYDNSAPMQHLSATLDRHIQPIIHAAWDAVPMGYSVLEAVWSPVGQGADLQRVSLLPMEYFKPRTDGSLLGTLPGIGHELTLDNTLKFFDTVRQQSINAPHGVAMLAPLYWPWHFRQHGWRYWMQFLERFGMPIVSGQVNDPAAFVNAMAGLGINTAIGVGPTDTVTIVAPSASGEFERLEIALCKRIQKHILGQTLTTDVGSSGSYAASQTHDLVRQDRKASDLLLVQATVQRIAAAFWALNRYSGPCPIITMEDGKGLEAGRALRDAELVKAGVLQLTEQYLLTHYDFEPGDFTLPAPTAPTAPDAPDSKKDTEANSDSSNPPATLSASFSATCPVHSNPGNTPHTQAPGRAQSQRFTPGQQVAEALVELAIADAPLTISTAALKAAITEATGPDDLAARIGPLMAGNSAAAFAAVIDKALFAAETLGWANAEQRRY